MTTEQAFLERASRPTTKPEPLPLFSTAERLALWTHQFGEPTSAAEPRFRLPLDDHIERMKGGSHGN